MEDLTIKIDKGEKADELSDKIINLINEYSNVFNGYELIGILDSVKQTTHNSLEEMEIEE